MNNGGDTLASGRAKSATFGPANVTAEKWAAIWSTDECSNDTKPEKTDPTGARVATRSKTSKQIQAEK